VAVVADAVDDVVAPCESGTWLKVAGRTPLPGEKAPPERLSSLISGGRYLGDTA
jgi:hypothetical protein